jgi:serine/threonine protein kinase
MDSVLFGPYRLEELLGRGGMGDVHRAFDTVHGRTVALKRLRPELATDAEFQARFRRECRLAARLREAHVVPIHDFGEIDGRLYLDMRLIEGTDLATLLAESGPLPPHRAVDVVAQVASALDAAHAEDMVHRDVKPSNVLLAGEGATGHDFAYLVDFGVAGAVGGSGDTSLTVTGATVGTLDYIAPERFQGGPYDRRVDVYSLACVLHEALTGRPPFGGEGLAAMIHAHLNLDPPAPSREHADIPPGLDTVIARGMAKDPDARYPTAGALANAAWAALSAAPQDTRAGAGPPPVIATQTAHSRRDGSTATGRPIAAAWPEPPRHVVPRRPVAATQAPGVPPRQVAETQASPAGSGTSSGPPGRHRAHVPRRGLIVFAVVAVVAAGIAGWFFAAGAPNQAAATVVRTEPVLTAGENPFMPPVGKDQSNVTPPPKSRGTFAGNTPGLYGGSGDNAICDPKAMVAFLQEHPDKADAWAGVLGITAAEIPNYVAGLTPVILRSDTAVTNHGFVDGRATTVNSVLQAGTAVMVDSYGVPRVRCYCGNPLTPAVATASPTYVGPTWPTFSSSSVTFIEQVNVVINEFVVVEVLTNRILAQPRGSSGTPERPLREVSAPPESSGSGTSPQTPCTESSDPSSPLSACAQPTTTPPTTPLEQRSQSTSTSSPSTTSPSQSKPPSTSSTTPRSLVKPTSTTSTTSQSPVKPTSTTSTTSQSPVKPTSTTSTTSQSKSTTSTSQPHTSSTVYSTTRSESSNWTL